MHCHEVGLEDPSISGKDALKGLSDQNTGKDNGSTKNTDNSSSYNEWIKTTQTDRNAQNNVTVLSQIGRAHV